MSKTQRTILLVDDNQDILSLLTNLFLANGFTVKSACNAIQAYALLSEDVDLVLTDLDMPGMNGMELTAHLKKEFDVPVVAITGLQLMDSKLFDAVVHKPIRPKDLLETVRVFLS